MAESPKFLHSIGNPGRRHDDVRFLTWSRNIAVLRMRNEIKQICNLVFIYGRIAKIAAQFNHRLVNSAMGQIPCSTERISCFLIFSLHQYEMTTSRLNTLRAVAEFGDDDSVDYVSIAPDSMQAKYVNNHNWNCLSTMSCLKLWLAD